MSDYHSRFELLPRDVRKKIASYLKHNTEDYHPNAEALRSYMRTEMQIERDCAAHHRKTQLRLQLAHKEDLQRELKAVKGELTHYRNEQFFKRQLRKIKKEQQQRRLEIIKLIKNPEKLANLNV